MAKADIGGRGEIRTHETLSRLPVFKTGALNHSATLPRSGLALERAAAQSYPESFNKIAAPRRGRGAGRPLATSHSLSRRDGARPVHFRHNLTTLEFNTFSARDGDDVALRKA
jgi:hypothetical protein